MKKNYIIPIFVPHLGCPNDCIFCNQKSISGQKDSMTKDKAKKIIDNYLANVDTSDGKIEIAFFGGSFTAIDEQKQEELLQVAYEYIENGKVEDIRISTRPDAINKQILKRLKKYKVKTIELGVQSANDYILKRAGRGHTFDDVKKVSKLQLPYHRAFKKNTFVNAEGVKQVPEKPNTFKFEKFIFDAFSEFDDMLLLRVNPNEEFAPIKDFTSIYNPDTAKQKYENYHFGDASKIGIL